MQMARESARKAANAFEAYYDPFDGLRRLAVQECARTGTRASYPSGYLELNSQLNDSAGARDFRRILPFDADKARRIQAKGISLGNLTDPEMGSVTEYDSRFKTDTPYYRAIQAQAGR